VVVGKLFPLVVDPVPETVVLAETVLDEGSLEIVVFNEMVLEAE
jgi:hypothetical protein